MARIAALIARAVTEDDAQTRAEVSAEVADLVAAFPAYPTG
jgi:glycine/serine hydroxymethyltransferase